jgi:hypothetical protein
MLPSHYAMVRAADDLARELGVDRSTTAIR